ncbi:MAG: twin-arginine translocation signal domain-containing protein [Alphaproteobacteria bacterium]|nr:twin-arginine translocation signal domain-containing protein [Alphaproteobacteria bacterium]
MTRRTEDKGLARRDFLKAAGIGVAAAAAAGAAAVGPAAASENRDQRKRARYRETDHVKKFYASNRL